MKSVHRNIFAALVLMLSVLSLVAEAATDRRDERALAVLKQMSSYKDSFTQLSIDGSASSDARLAEGLLVAHTQEVKVHIKREGSLYFRRFDGISAKELYIHNGVLTLSNSETGYYAQAETPKDTDQALDFALEKFGIDLPLMDLLKRDTFGQLVEPTDEIIYLSDKSRVAGVDCHHIAIRTPEVDVQIWIEEGARPLPRRIVITSKWEGGAPRFVANMSWNTSPEIATGQFDFSPGEGNTRIEFITQISD